MSSPLTSVQQPFAAAPDYAGRAIVCSGSSHRRAHRLAWPGVKSDAVDHGAGVVPPITGPTWKHDAGMPLVGRDHDIERVRSFVDHATAHGDALLLSGD